MQRSASKYSSERPLYFLSAAALFLTIFYHLPATAQTNEFPQLAERLGYDRVSITDCVLTIDLRPHAIFHERDPLRHTAVANLHGAFDEESLQTATNVEPIWNDNGVHTLKIWFSESRIRKNIRADNSTKYKIISRYGLTPSEYFSSREKTIRNSITSEIISAYEAIGRTDFTFIHFQYGPRVLIFDGILMFSRSPEALVALRDLIVDVATSPECGPPVG